MDFIEIIFHSCCWLYVGLLIPTFLEADRRAFHTEQERASRGKPWFQWVMGVLNALACIPIGILALELNPGPIGSSGIILSFGAPILAYFITMSLRPGKFERRWQRILWRCAQYIGLIALIFCLGVGACSLQPIKYEFR